MHTVVTRAILDDIDSGQLAHWYLARSALCRRSLLVGMWRENVFAGAAWAILSPHRIHKNMNTVFNCKAADQPIAEWSIEFDGRIDNRDDLRKRLAGGDHSRSDADLVLASYREWADDCVLHLEGDFAFCVRDPERQHVFLARDRMGLKCLYYHLHGRELYYSSSLSRLVEVLPGQLECELKMVAGQLYGHWWDPRLTFYKNIFCVAPAHSLIWNEHGLREKQFWKISARPPLVYDSDQEYAEHFLEIFSRAVSHRLSPNGRNGIFLSGGVDSSAVAEVAAKAQAEMLHRRPLAAYSLGFDDHACDDSAIIQEFVKGRPWLFKLIYPERDPASVDLNETNDADDIVYSPSFYLLRSLLRAAENDGVRTILTGHGGDDVFNPGFYAAEMLQGFKFGGLVKHLKSLQVSYRLQLNEVWREGLRPILSSYLPTWGRALFPRPPAVDLLEPRYLRDSGILDEVDSSFGSYHQEFSGFCHRSLARRLYLSGGYAFAFRQFQALGQRYGVEFRFPLFDQALIDFAFRLPPEQFFKDGVAKRVLRNSMQGRLQPKWQMRRYVQEFEPVLRRSCARQKSTMDSFFDESRLVAAGLIDKTKLKTAARQDAYGVGLILIFDLEYKMRALEARSRKTQ